MISAVLSTVKDNTTLMATAGVGLAAGGALGAYLGGSTLVKVLLGLGLGAAGAIGGGFAGHKYLEYQDRKTPAVLGVRVLEGETIQPNQQGQVAVRPSFQMADDIVAVTRNKLDNDQRLTTLPAEHRSKLEQLLPVLQHGLPHSTIRFSGNANADGTFMQVSGFEGRVAGMSLSQPLSGVKLPLKNGVIDVQHPETKNAMLKVIHSVIQTKLPAQYHHLAEECAKEVLEKQALPNLQSSLHHTRQPFDGLIGSEQRGLAYVSQPAPGEPNTNDLLPREAGTSIALG
jgi:hypothetical protein